MDDAPPSAQPEPSQDLDAGEGEVAEEVPKGEEGEEEEVAEPQRVRIVSFGRLYSVARANLWTSFLAHQIRQPHLNSSMKGTQWVMP